MPPALIVVLGVAVLYWFPIRRWMGRWGTTGEEVARVMAGDAFIDSPTDVANQAVTVDAPPEDVWPWLAQLGYQRGGLYSYDWLDRLFGFLDRPSADRVLPEFQRLVVGDKVSLGPRMEMTVVAVEPAHTLALSAKAEGLEWVWQFGLYPVDEHRTRLISRGSERVANTFVGRFLLHLMEPAAFIMTRRMLLGVKERAETLSGQNRIKPRLAAQHG